MSRSRKPLPRRELELAAQLYGDFRERSVGQLKRRQVDWPTVAVHIGRVLAIEYETTHGQRPVRYRHAFKKGARPELSVSADGRMPLISPGNFVFTARGFVDNARPGTRRSRR